MDKSKERAIELAAKHHKEFVDMVGVFIGNHHDGKNYAEDIVQEAYIRLLRYDDLYDKIIKKDGTVSKGYVFFVIRSIAINHVKKKSNLDYLFGYFNGSGFYDEEIKSGDMSPRIQEKYEELCRMDVDLHKQVVEKLENKMLDVLKDNADWFDYELFKLYAHSGKSYKIISEETGIASKTIYLSIKKSKLIIAEHLHEDYQDYVNGNWDLIE